ncbi:MAG: L-serine ammonia-lyase [Pseudomonadota bacterium]|nr:L-serine ammonia-lyase [Pseudomonadota bacterium]
MFISVLELFKIGIGPSSSHTMGPMVAAKDFIEKAGLFCHEHPVTKDLHLHCTLKGSLAYTGKGHATDRAVTLGLHGYTPAGMANYDADGLYDDLASRNAVALNGGTFLGFSPRFNIEFDLSDTLPQHPNGMVFQLLDGSDKVLIEEVYFSIGGGFIASLEEIGELVAPMKATSTQSCPYPFDSARSMVAMANSNKLSIADMKRANETAHITAQKLEEGLDAIWHAMQRCINNGLSSDGCLPGGLNIARRAKKLFHYLKETPDQASLNEWLCAYAMAVNEENAAGRLVVTAPTNGAAGVIPAVLNYIVEFESMSRTQVHDFLLTAAAIGGLIKHRSSISGAEVGCQGEVGSAAAMAAAGLCAVRGGTPQQVENAAEIALEHHLGMTCDPVNGLVQVPCIERNGFGAIKAYTAASLAIHGTGEHFMPLDNCIEAMKQTGLEMSHKYKETSLGGLAVSFTEC